ncbi:thiosulfate/3-mercaptopyruvate sulfurtransferase [Streptosporangium becharense]|uniref:Thiosulfate/3-mercaptopyruvate sulfurtransferase n=1 Tax=Streptosporangium becharense TaxID=1816182 RepID=A0A7W9MJ26_9ACTN|nr:sulfurtransferase [Streptosporangium becharense]MBB2913223.1 thiosulfate/3-mercaptopyruvate sulfurtransferase [Streptosporangium becharense]MBB5822206.1 thiosulfate/3-mercaptopyruvate sulfurtransferase [Streptosporangium becharense]
MSPLIDPAELAGMAGAAVLDVRWKLGGPPGIDAYRAGHIPGAVFCDLEADLAASPGRGGRHPLPSPEAFQESMRRLGVSASRPVVVYDAADSTAAARAWWALRHFGHPDVRVLDGGLRAWTAEGRPLAEGDEAAEPGDFTARPGGMPVLDADRAARLAADGLLLDARAAERYRGEVEPIDPVAGHIPGAVSAPTGENVDPSGRFHLPEFLRERFNTLGAVPGVEVGAYCGSGVTAAHQVLALEVAGIPAALYVGSWSDWVSDPSRPVATG